MGDFASGFQAFGATIGIPIMLALAFIGPKLGSIMPCCCFLRAGRVVGALYISITAITIGFAAGTNFSIIFGIISLVLGLAAIASKRKPLREGGKLDNHTLFLILSALLVLFIIRTVEPWAFAFGIIFLIIITVLVFVFGGEFLVAGAESAAELGEMSGGKKAKMVGNMFSSGGRGLSSMSTRIEGSVGRSKIGDFNAWGHGALNSLKPGDALKNQHALHDIEGLKSKHNRVSGDIESLQDAFGRETDDGEKVKLQARIDAKKKEIEHLEDKTTAQQTHLEKREAGEKSRACLAGYVIAALLLLLFIILAVRPQLLPASVQIVSSEFFDGAFSFIDGLARGAISGFFKLFAAIVPQNIAGVPITGGLKYQSCYPFCTTPSESKADVWKGLEISRFEIIPTQLYDYQRISIVTEFANNGVAEATVSLPVDSSGIALSCDPGSSGIVAEEVQNCEWDFNLDSLLSGDLKTCIVPACPFSADQSAVRSYTSGGCRNPDGSVWTDRSQGDKCTIAPGDTQRITWFGITPEPDLVGFNIVASPELTIGIKYKFRPSTDLIGSVVVQDIQSQVASVETKKLGRIINKISQSYSPVGPMQMAFGTAETQVIKNVPSLFIMQFANKGKGALQPIAASDIILYLHKDFNLISAKHVSEFTEREDPNNPFSGTRDTNFAGIGTGPYKNPNSRTPENQSLITIPNQDGVITSDLCDFVRLGNVSDVTRPGAFDYPGPGFEDHVVYLLKAGLFVEWGEKGGFKSALNPLDNPVKSCVLDTSRTESLRAYTFKAKVLEYEYAETKTQSVNIIGTSLAPKITEVTSETRIATRIKEDNEPVTGTCDRNDGSGFYCHERSFTFDPPTENVITIKGRTMRQSGDGCASLGFYDMYAATGDDPELKLTNPDLLSITANSWAETPTMTLTKPTTLSKIWSKFSHETNIAAPVTMVDVFIPLSALSKTVAFPCPVPERIGYAITYVTDYPSGGVVLKEGNRYDIVNKIVSVSTSGGDFSIERINSDGSALINPAGKNLKKLSAEDNTCYGAEGTSASMTVNSGDVFCIKLSETLRYRVAVDFLNAKYNVGVFIPVEEAPEVPEADTTTEGTT